MKIFCVGRNYKEHTKELNNPDPQEPVIFLKPKSALVHSGKPLIHPLHTIEWEYEAEIVVRICRNGKEILAEEAYNYYKEYTLGLDLTARDVQRNLKSKGLPWEIAKAYDGSAFIGDFMKLEPNMNIQEMEFELIKNGVLVQEGNTSDMTWEIDQLIAYISKYFTLNIGDLLFTGTPAGVGELNPSDELTGLIDGQEVFQTYVV